MKTFKRVLMSVLKRLPENMRLQLYRNRTRVPEETFSSRFTVEIASTSSDLERAYSLLHDCYVNINIMKPNALGWRVNHFSLSPHTTTIVVKDNGKVVGTVALIRDSYLGLPCDKEYQKENNELRRGHRCLVEVSALAVAKEYRVSHCVSLMLMKYLHNFAKSNLHGDYLVCVVHPLAEDFYKALFGFKRHGDVVDYGGANGALGIHMSFEISPAHEQIVLNSYNSQELNRNAFAFILQGDKRFKLPTATPERCIYPVLSERLKNYYKAKMNITTGEENRETRWPIDLSVRIRSSHTILPARMRDISSHGCYIELDKNEMDQLNNFEIHFQFQGQQYRIPVTAMWKNKVGSSRYSAGLGIKFKNAEQMLSLELKQWTNWNETAAATTAFNSPSVRLLAS